MVSRFCKDTDQFSAACLSADDRLHDELPKGSALNEATFKKGTPDILIVIMESFAEFLDNASSAGLRILSSSTCVGLRYGYNMNDSGFS